ncbi:hypothetical protein GCM10010442_55070 [Kitasatospora kifunensis]
MYGCWAVALGALCIPVAATRVQAASAMVPRRRSRRAVRAGPRWALGPDGRAGLAGRAGRSGRGGLWGRRWREIFGRRKMRN